MAKEAGISPSSVNQIWRANDLGVAGRRVPRMGAMADEEGSPARFYRIRIS